MRVVSLIPSATEILFALDEPPVGVSHQCEHLPAADGIPVITEPVPDTDATQDSETIHANVAGAEHDGVYAIDVPTLEALDPDVVLTQELCEVCALPAADLDAALDDTAVDPEIVRLDPGTVGEVIDEVEVIGEAVGRGATAAALADSLRDRVSAVERRVADADDRPRVAVLDWMDPVIVTGHWVPDLVERAGGTYGLADTGKGSVTVGWDGLREYDPECLFVVPCGYSVEETFEHSHELTDREGWEDLAAVGSDDVYVLEGCGYINCPGPKLVDSMELVASVLHDDGTIPDSMEQVYHPLRESRELPVNGPL